ncbi:hypothetical protein IWQ61_007807 [Dispira simplex]|nr:hypothetical protein IWQ61_007807 [Dispira simplex]
MGNVRRARKPRANTNVRHKYRARHRTRDFDQIYEDVKPENIQKLLLQPLDVDLPGGGQHYCVECARHFISEHALTGHKKTQSHKRRVKQLKTETPYSQKEAEAAVGLFTDNGPRSRTAAIEPPSFGG